jgi:PelA/Pel-15E family pectate lyase
MRVTLALVCLFAAFTARAAIIGTNIPASPLTAERIAALPPADQPAWRDYLDRSARQFKADRQFFQDEMASNHLPQATVPRGAHNAKDLSLKNPPEWYGRPEARHTANVIVSFQTPAGGWSKNLNLTRFTRAPGEEFAPNNDSKFIGTNDFDASPMDHWHYVGTFDNDATITELRFLAKVIAATDPHWAGDYRAAFQRGMDYVFASQFPNGGWPQVWPLEGGYHDYITVNDDAMLHCLALVHDVAAGRDEFAFVPAETRARAAAAYQKGLACLLAAQLVTDGRRTVWAQQHDALTLQPASARNYEMPAQTSSESAEIVLFLMQLPDPDSNVVTAVRSAVKWFEKTELNNVEFKSIGKDGRKLIPSPGAGPLWSRYYEIGTDRPIFGDRDKSIHDDVNELSKERRKGYQWYNNTAKRVLEHFRRWSKDHPE